MKNITISAVLVSGLCLASSFVSDHGQALMEASMATMKNMKAMKMTGHPDHDFSMMMAEHHRGAIKMSEIELKSGKDESLKLMAQKMIVAQGKEIKEFENFTSTHHDHSTMSTDKEFTKKTMDNMAMSEKKMKAMKMSGDLDKDFATMMIDHHKDALDMAKAEIAHGKDEKMKSIAEKILEDQQKEIVELEKFASKK